MSGYALVLHGERIDALVVGGGSVAARKAAALAAAGGRVRIVAPEICDAMRALLDASGIDWTARAYESGDIGAANLIFAATSSRDVNSLVTTDAISAGRLVNVADAPEEGDFSTVAQHRDGPLLVAVHAGGVPGAAARIRDALSELLGPNFGAAIERLLRLRRDLLRRNEANRWNEASRALIGAEFVENVRTGRFKAEFEQWG